jgi:hypothetical protein
MSSTQTVVEVSIVMHMPVSRSAGIQWEKARVSVSVFCNCSR